MGYISYRSAFVPIMIALASDVVQKQCRLHTMTAVVLCSTGSLIYAQPEFLLGGDGNITVLRPLCGHSSPNLLSSNFSEEDTHGP